MLQNIEIEDRIGWIATTGPLQDDLECEVPGSIEPLLALIDSFTTLAFLGGIGLGVLGFSIAALMIMLPGQDWTRAGKRLAKHVLIGVILLLAAPMIVDYLVAQMGEEAFC